MNPQARNTLRAIWRRAGSSQTPVRIPCASKNEASRVRLSLYRSVASVRANPAEDPGLAEILERCGVSYEDDAKTILLVGENALPDALKRVAEGLGITGAEAKSSTELQAAESLNRLLQGNPDLKPQAGTSDGLGAPNPYYDRKG